VRLVGVSVQGLRCLVDVGPIPVGNPAILTGPNDAGKSTLLFGLDFLLGGGGQSQEDLSRVSGETEEPTSEIVVEGTFELDTAVEDRLELASPLTLRRVYREGRSEYEILTNAPIDSDLQDLGDHLPLAILKERVERLGLEPDGPRTSKASYLGPLKDSAEASPKEEQWMPAPRAAVDELPRMVKFASSQAPDPEQEITSSLKEVYTQILEDEEISGPIANVEAAVKSRLNLRAQALCEHIREQCQELTDVDVIPSVSFRGGFQGVSLRTGRGEDATEGLRQAGAGRKRRITLAIWEWVAGLLDEEERDRAVLIAYDEPDTHLDYLRQRELMDLVRKQAAYSNVQVLVATHSLNLIDRVDIADLIALELDETGGTLVRTLDDQGHQAIDDHLQRLAVSMGLRNSVLLHERCFLIVEGDTEMGAFPLLFRTVTGFSLQAAGIALLNGGNNDGALRVAQFLNDNGRAVRFILDNDSRTNPASRKIFSPDRLQRLGIDQSLVAYLGDPDNLEDTFPDTTWAMVANGRWPRADGRDWMPEDFGALRSDGFASGLQELVRLRSEDAPLSKTGYVGALAEELTEVDDIPRQIIDAFRAVFEAANAA